MNVALSQEQKLAMAKHPGRPLTVEDPETHEMFVLVKRELYQELQNSRVYDDSDLTPEEMMAAAQHRLDDPEGWGAPGMEIYDDYEPPKYDPPREDS